jgi:hypothetical protein
MANEPELLGASTSISDGEVLDWAQLERTAPSERERAPAPARSFRDHRWHASDVCNDRCGAGGTHAHPAAASPVILMPERLVTLMRQRVGAGPSARVSRLGHDAAAEVALVDARRRRARPPAANAALKMTPISASDIRTSRSTAPSAMTGASVGGVRPRPHSTSA